MAIKYFNGSIKNLVNRLKKFDAIVEQELKDEILRNEDIIVKMITESQLYNLGIEGRGIEIASYAPYKQSTIKRKQKKGQPYNRVTLKDKGEFYKSLKVVFDDNGFFVTSTDEIAGILLKKYGNTILRLSNDNLNILLREHIRPSLEQKLKNYILNG